VGGSLRVAQECSRKTYAKSGRDDCAYGNSGGIQTIFGQGSSPAGVKLVA
jgi:hypothetical protein